MRTWIKITKGDRDEAIRALEQLAVHKPEVCIKDKLLDYALPAYDAVDTRWTMDYLRDLEAVTLERCKTIISKSDVPTGEYDFYFEWYEDPTKEYLNSLKKEVEVALKPLDVEYEIVNK